MQEDEWRKLAADLIGVLQELQIENRALRTLLAYHGIDASDSVIAPAALDPRVRGPILARFAEVRQLLQGATLDQVLAALRALARGCQA